jgi:hypothetical protein
MGIIYIFVTLPQINEAVDSYIDWDLYRDE